MHGQDNLAKSSTFLSEIDVVCSTWNLLYRCSTYANKNTLIGLYNLYIIIEYCHFACHKFTTQTQIRSRRAERRIEKTAATTSIISESFSWCRYRRCNLYKSLLHQSKERPTEKKPPLPLCIDTYYIYNNNAIRSLSVSVCLCMR